MRGECGIVRARSQDFSAEGCDNKNSFSGVFSKDWSLVGFLVVGSFLVYTILWRGLVAAGNQCFVSWDDY